LKKVFQATGVFLVPVPSLGWPHDVSEVTIAFANEFLGRIEVSHKLLDITGYWVYNLAARMALMIRHAWVTFHIKHEEQNIHRDSHFAILIPMASGCYGLENG
jgi:hypothetical protein